MRLALARRERLVYTPQCFAFGVPGGGPARPLYRGVEQALVPRTAALIAVAQWERDLAARTLRGSARRLRLVRNGVGPCPDTEPEAGLRAFAAGGPLVGMVAALRPQKDPLALVRAAALLLERGAVGARVAIVGNGPLQGAVRAEIARLGVGDSVRWFPFTPPVSRYLRGLDVFALPSLWEALPVAPIEAMTCGLPVVAARVGGVPEIVSEGSTGLIVEPGRPEALADGLERLLADPDLRQAMGREGRRVARERFTVEGMADATAAVYQDLLARGRR